jgi:hypothetical protein
MAVSWICDDDANEGKQVSRKGRTEMSDFFIQDLLSVYRIH